MNPISRNIVFTLLLVGMIVCGAHADIPRQISFQGQLLDDAGTAIVDGAYEMEFSLYNLATGGTALWTEYRNVVVHDGIFQVNLGAQTYLDLPFDVRYYLGIRVGTDPEMHPRLPLASVGYAFWAANAESLNGFDSTDFLSTDGGLADLDLNNILVQGLGSFDDNGEEAVVYLGDINNYIKAVHGAGVSIGTFDAADAIVVEPGTGNVGIGTSTPEAKLDVAGRIHASGTLQIGSQAKHLAIFTDGGVVDLKSTGASLGINYPGDTDTVINVGGGRVGIGTFAPAEKLSVAGTVESTSGGFKYPDGTSQTTAGPSQAYVNTLEARVLSLEAQVTALVDLFENVTRNDNDITFSGVNIHVVNGTGTADGDVNGLGNLIVGYNEERGSDDDRSGSHNIVVGALHNYSSYGGLVVGYYNTISGDYASVSGGTRNTASGNNASISGGSYNKASGRASFVGGGGSGNSSDGNEAFGNYTAILGGHNNLTGDQDRSDHTVGQNATISGGTNNLSTGNSSSVSGGTNNLSNGNSSSVSGGRYNIASGAYSFVGGGGTDFGFDEGNNAFGDYTAILGGAMNITGDPQLRDNTLGRRATVSGGYGGIASGNGASVSGGNGNQASGSGASVLGGNGNQASGSGASVSGGRNNKASGDYSFVGGGGGRVNPLQSNVAFGHYTAILGGIRNIAGDPDFSDHDIGQNATVSSGDNNKASGIASSISGGINNKASGDYSFVGGGGHYNPAYGNEAFSNYSAVLGGAFNIAGDNTDPENHSIGELSTITGGDTNRAKGGWSTISGGLGNTTELNHTSVSGGAYNTANNSYATVSGGHSNTAAGASSAVSGGYQNTANGTFDSVIGDHDAVYVDSTQVCLSPCP